MQFTKKLLFIFLAFTLFSYSWVFASWIDHFEVEFNPSTVKVNETLDLTIEAVDKNNETVLDYEWTILIFSESDPEAELPSALEENSFTFSASDQWKIKFENWVKFKSDWTQNIHVYDLNDETVFWVAESIVEEQVEIVTNIDISIISPENWLTIWENSIWISWTTNKNHQVKIIVNWTEELLTTSNSDWIFEKTVENLNDWEVSLVAKILDADWNVIWESDEVKISVELSSLSIKNVKLTPEELETWDSYEIEVISNHSLSKVNAIVNDTIIELIETEDWIYTAKSSAPSEAWTYSIDINIQDELWHKKTELWAASLTVNEVVLDSAWESWTWNVEITEEPEIVEETTITDDKLKITWLKLVELKSKSVLTWNEVKDAESYNVYKKNSEWKLELIDNSLIARFEVEYTWDNIKYNYFAVKAVSRNEEWETYEWNLSEATKVKTGPEILILFLISLIIGWFFFIRKQRA